MKERLFVVLEATNFGTKIGMFTFYFQSLKVVFH